MQLDLNALITGKILLDNGGGGGGAGITKIAEKEFTVSTTSTTEIEVGDVPLDEAYWTGEKIFLVTVLDKAGKRAGYHYGTMSAFANYMPKNGSTSSLSTIPVYSVYVKDDSKYSGTGSPYGVYAKYHKKASGINICAKYNGSSSKTIDGTFKVTVYQMDIPFLA